MDNSVANLASIVVLLKGAELSGSKPNDPGASTEM